MNLGRLDQPVQLVSAPGGQAPDQEELFQNADVLLGGAQVESELVADPTQTGDALFDAGQFCVQARSRKSGG